MLQYVDTVLGFAIVMLLLSLLVTSIVQAAVAWLGTRSKTLECGLQKLLQQVHPSVTEEAAQTLAAAVLAHPSIAADGSQGATAIRYDELMNILRALNESLPDEPKTAQAKKAIGFALDVRSTVLPQFKEEIHSLTEELQRSFPGHAKHVSDAVNSAFKKVADTKTGITTWFNTIMDQTADNFVQKTRHYTRWTAIGLVLLLQIDSLSILQQLVANPETRAQLVQNSQAILDKATEIQTLQQDSAQIASTVLTDLINDANVPALDKVPAVPGDLVTFNQGKQWIAGLKDVNENDKQIWLDRFENQFERENTASFLALQASTDQIKAYLDESRLNLFAAPWFNPDYPWRDLFGPESPVSLLGLLRRAVGLIMSIIFLSLGAPFWYNTLRQVSSLRPLIAGKVEAKGKDE